MICVYFLYLFSVAFFVYLFFSFLFYFIYIASFRRYIDKLSCLESVKIFIIRNIFGNFDEFYRFCLTKFTKKLCFLSICWGFLYFLYILLVSSFSGSLYFWCKVFILFRVVVIFREKNTNLFKEDFRPF